MRRSARRARRRRRRQEGSRRQRRVPRVASWVGRHRRRRAFLNLQCGGLRTLPTCPCASPTCRTFVVEAAVVGGAVGGTPSGGTPSGARLVVFVFRHQKGVCAMVSSCGPFPCCHRRHSQRSARRGSTDAATKAVAAILGRAPRQVRAIGSSVRAQSAV